MKSIKDLALTVLSVPFVLCAIALLGLVFVFVGLKMFFGSDRLRLP